MFVKFECGCVGLTGKTAGTSDAIIIKACDEDREAPVDSLSWARRDMSLKTATPLSEVAEMDLHQQIARRMGRADAADHLRSAMGFVLDRS